MEAQVEAQVGGRPARFGQGDWISVPAAADLLCLSRMSVIRMIRRGLLSPRRFEGMHPRLNRAEVLALAESRRRDGGGGDGPCSSSS